MNKKGKNKTVAAIETHVNATDVKGCDVNI